MKHISWIRSVLYVFASLFLGLPTDQVLADGSKDLYPDGVQGGRAVLVSSITPATGWPFTVPGVHYVYVKAGEIIAAASSAQGLGNGQIIVISPHGDVSYSAIGNTEEGHIANRDEELGGPKLNEEDDTENRYTPFTVTADEDGIWTVWFLPTGNVAAGPSGGSSSHSVNDADGTWKQYVSTTNSHSIYAWDVSVINAGETRSEEHTSELQSRENLVCRLLPE